MMSKVHPVVCFRSSMRVYTAVAERTCINRSKRRCIRKFSSQRRLRGVGVQSLTLEPAFRGIRVHCLGTNHADSSHVQAVTARLREIRPDVVAIECDVLRALNYLRSSQRRHIGAPLPALRIAADAAETRSTHRHTRPQSDSQRPDAAIDGTHSILRLVGDSDPVVLSRLESYLLQNVDVTECLRQKLPGADMLAALQTAQQERSRLWLLDREELITCARDTAFHMISSQAGNTRFLLNYGIRALSGDENVLAAISERDMYMAAMLRYRLSELPPPKRKTDGWVVAVVVGSFHLEGLQKHWADLMKDPESMINALSAKGDNKSANDESGSGPSAVRDSKDKFAARHQLEVQTTRTALELIDRLTALPTDPKIDSNTLRGMLMVRSAVPDAARLDSLLTLWRVFKSSFLPEDVLFTFAEVMKYAGAAGTTEVLLRREDVELLYHSCVSIGSAKRWALLLLNKISMDTLRGAKQAEDTWRSVQASIF